MNELLNIIIAKIEKLNPLHAKKLKKAISSFDREYFKRANDFFAKYNDYLLSVKKDLEFGINAYLKMCGDIMYEQIRFQQTGEYPSKSYAKVKERVYGNKEIMEYYMNGLLLSQFLWPQHYYILRFFIDTLPKFRNVKSYLEVGAGHGLYIAEAIKAFGNRTKYAVLDVSETSISVSRKFVGDKNIQFILDDIYQYNTEEKYDFITMGEVLEHVEEPVALLGRVNDLLFDQGHVFISVPTNAPAIDHIYLFRNEEEIIDVVHRGGFDVIESYSVYSEDVPKKKAEKMKLTMIYGAFLKKHK